MLRRAAGRLRFVRDHRWVPPHASDYLDGDLGPQQITRVQRHLEECRECRELLRSLQAIVSALGSLCADQGEPVAGVVLASVKGRLADRRPTTG